MLLKIAAPPRISQSDCNPSAVSTAGGSPDLPFARRESADNYSIREYTLHLVFVNDFFTKYRGCAGLKSLTICPSESYVNPGLKQFRSTPRIRSGYPPPFAPGRGKLGDDRFDNPQLLGYSIGCRSGDVMSRRRGAMRIAGSPCRADARFCSGRSPADSQRLGNKPRIGRQNEAKIEPNGTQCRRRKSSIFECQAGVRCQIMDSGR